MLYRNNTTLIALFILAILGFHNFSHAQLNTVTIGHASDLGGNCFEITPDQGYRAGGVWYDNPIDFADDFTIYYQNNFGTKDYNGADGMALVFKKEPNPEIGQTGQGLGYKNINNTLVVEFDTYYNGNESDPNVDHIGIMSNGVANHSASSSLAGPIQASLTSANIEDGIDHDIKIVWTASTKTLDVYFDCNLRLSVTNDVKTTIFNGDSTVFFGFVGSTGGYANLHKVCFNSISFVENLNLVDANICVGETLSLDATIPSGISYSWSPTTAVSNPNNAITTVSPTVTTTYTVTIDDVCGNITTEDVLIVVNSDVTPSFPASSEFFCDGNTNPLTNTSIEGITGSWSPAFDATTTATYSFTPDAGQCADPITLTVIVDPQTIPTFTQTNDICNEDTLNPLPTTSNNAITGTWTPALDNTITTTYTFTPDPGQCAVATTMTVVVNQKITPTFPQTNDICNGDILAPLPTTSNDGIVGAWEPALDNTATTTYTFTPNEGECANPTTLTITVEQKTDPSFTAVDAICDGDILTPLPITSNNGIAGTWTPALDNTLTTTYTFTPDASECANPTTLTINVNQKVDPVFNPADDICNGDILTPLPTTANNSITGTWTPALDNTITTLYTFTPDAGLCANPTTLTIFVNQKVDPLFTAVNDICNGDVLALLPPTSNNSITGTWTPALDNTITTTYTFTPDLGECANPTTLTINVNQKVNPDFNAVNDICNGNVLAPLPPTSNDGITGTWSPALDNTITTTYTFTPDLGECANLATLTINVNQKIDPDFNEIDAICDGDILNPLPTTSNNGVNGTWTPALDNTLTTEYTFTPDAGECANPTTVTINVNQKVDPDFNEVDAICDGDALNSLPTTSNNGVNGTWSPALDNTITTTYTFTPGAGECANPTTLTINVNQKVNPLFTPVNDICNGGILTPLPTTDNNGITGTWTPALDNTLTTLYTFTPDAGECANAATLVILVNQKTDPTFATVNDFCNGAVLTPLPTTSNNGITGTWSPALDNTLTTLYTFTPDAELCANPTTLTITVNDLVDPLFTPAADICNGDILTPLPTSCNNGITGSWTPALDNTITTTYTFTPDVGECANPATLTIFVNQKLYPDFNEVDAICDGDILNPLPTTSNNGVNGTWTPALDNTLTTLYTFTPDVGECANTETLTIFVNQKLYPDFNEVDAICDGDILNPLPTTSNNGVNGTWTPALDNTLTTLYTFTPDVGECANTETLTILVNQKVDPLFTAVADVCNGDVLTPLPTTSNNGITGSWTPALDNTLTTTYTFTPRPTECANPTTLTILVNQKVDPLFTPVGDICSGGSLAPLPTTSNDGITGTWSPTLDNTITNLYIFTPDVGECANPATLIINVNQNVNPLFTPVNDICNGDILTPLPTTANNGITGTWSPALDNTITTLYTFTPDARECANPTTLVILVNQKTDPIFAAVNDICNGDALTPLPTTANNGITGTWSPALDNTITTLYTFTPDARECANSATVTITVVPNSVSTFIQIDPICAGETITLLTQSNEGFNGTWSPALDNTTTTTYTFTADPGECASPTTMTVVVIPVNVLTISAVSLSDKFDANQIISVTASGGSGSYEYQLDGGDWQFSSIFEYVIGCDEHTVAVRDAIDSCNIQPETTIAIMEFPKFFTPNGDGYNDTWNIKCFLDDPFAVVRLSDRFGKLLYEFKPSQNTWDGSFNGEMLPSTDYWFVVNYTNSNGVETQYKSHFSLRR